MGIRFLCPNGHKLHVKAFLAGRRGKCPDCGERFLIPSDSLPDVCVEAIPARAEPARIDELSTTVTPSRVASDPLLLAAERFAEPIAGLEPVTQTASEPVAGTIEPANFEMPELALNVQDDADASTLGDSDPPRRPSGLDQILAEAGSKLWYIHLRSGAEHGPADGPMLREWINQGRVPPDALVWREGWDDWRPAADVFGLASSQPVPGRAKTESTTKAKVAAPQSATSSDSATATTAPTATDNVLGPLADDLEIPRTRVGEAIAPAQGIYRRRRTRQTNLTLVAVLAVAFLTLFPVVIYVLFRG